VARVHMHRRHQRRARMDDERDAARPNARILLGAGNLLPEFRAELAPDGRDIDAGLLEDAAFEDRHRAAAAAAAVAVPAFARETLRFAGSELVLDRFERGADAIAQRLEPCPHLYLLGLRFLLFAAHACSPGCSTGRSPVCRNASPNTMEAASATLIERRPGRIGRRTRASAAACTSAGTPALSRPRSSVSSAAKAK